MLFNIREIRQGLTEKFGEAVIYFQELAGQEAFIVNPSYQLCVFNYLLYEHKWKFDALKDVMLSFNPGLEGCEYALGYQLNSKLFQNKLQLLLPVDFSNPKVFSLCNQFKNAPKLEQELASIYDIHFVTKPTRFESFKKSLGKKVEPLMQSLSLLS
ncbi:MAG: hypothetical protein K2Q24_15980 [Chitinophagaceae bacterium]|jgi:hypothetical protein|nr:hypothetical protein [Chitinophagaceae bacterium]